MRCKSIKIINTLTSIAIGNLFLYIFGTLKLNGKPQIIKSKTMKNLILFFLSILLFLNTLQSQTIRISEISNSNANIFADEEGNYNDWIELFNSSATDSVSMLGYFLSDDKNKLNKWAFSDIIVPPRSFLLIQASGKDKDNQTHHWESVAFIANNAK